MLNWYKYGPRFDPKNEQSGNNGNESKNEETKKEETKVEPKVEPKFTYKINGEDVEFTREEVDALLYKGVDAYLAEQNNNKKEEPKKEETKKEEAPDKVAQLEKQLEEINKYLMNQHTASQQREFNNNVRDLLTEHNLDPKNEAYDLVKDIVTYRALSSKGKKLPDLVKETVEKFTGVVTKTKKEYLERKQEAASKTKGLGVGQPGGLEKPKPVSADEFLKGGVRKQVQKTLADRKTFS